MRYKKMKMDIAVVTGASSGLGKQIAKLLCETGKIIYITARREEELEKLKQECRREKYSGDIRIIAGDLTKKDFRIKLMNQIIKKEEKIDYLINNAGYGKVTNFENEELKDIEGMFQLNVIAGEHLTQLILPLMKKQRKGRIINISSVVALQPPVYMTSYNASKFAIYGFSKSLSYELKNTGVSVSVVFTSRMNTGFWDIAFKCRGLTEDKQKTCIAEYTKNAKGPLPIAKYIIKNLNNKKLIFTPDLLSWFSYHFLRHFYFIGDFYMKNIMLKQSKKLLFHNNESKMKVK